MKALISCEKFAIVQVSRKGSAHKHTKAASPKEKAAWMSWSEDCSRRQKSQSFFYDIDNIIQLVIALAC